MTFTYNPQNDIGKVRRTIPDKVKEEHFWEDEEIISFLSDEGDWRRATALALETMASDLAMVMQTVKVNDLETDGSKAAKALLDRAKVLRTQAVEAESSSDDGSFEIVTQIFDDFGYRERVLKDYIETS